VTIMTGRQRIKTIARWTGVLLAILSVAFAIVTYRTHWDWWLGDDMVEKRNGSTCLTRMTPRAPFGQKTPNGHRS
jgi:hypothetical protein